QGDEATTTLSEHVSTVQYSYNIPLNLYTKDSDGQIIKSDVMTLLSSMRAGVIGEEAEASVNATMTEMMEASAAQTGGSSQLVVWQEMLPGENGEPVNELLQQQYDVLYGAWPENYDEVVLIVDENNEVSDLVLYALGLKSANEMLEVMTAYMLGNEPEQSEISSWSYEDICRQSFRLILPADCYQRDPASGNYIDISAGQLGLQTLFNNAMELKIVGVVRQNADAVTGMMSGAIGYTNELTKKVAAETETKQIVADQLASSDRDIFSGLPFKADSSVPSDYELATVVEEYLASLDDAKKAEIYLAYASTPGEDYINGLIEQQLSGLTRADIEKTVLENYPEYAELMSSMDDDTLFGYMRQMMQEQIAAQYAEQVKSAMSRFSNSTLAKMLDSCYFTTEDYRTIYDQYMPEAFSDSSYEDNLRKLGYIDLDSPSSVNIYVPTFADKDAVAEIIEGYNSGVGEEDQISYTDYVALIMSSVTTIIDVISYVLIAFVAISLVVSSIMIGIITYISVLERTKEIGILRSIGASKRDISRVFNAETVIVGFGAGLIGILATLLLCIPINMIVHNLTGINSINAVLPGGAAVTLVIISMILTVIAGLIPSRVAANKDPVEALRTE
ncbi:MAG: ABC transporter permease, partial [Oscillospiraceae bacterium]|nr:ABC transporter permease [Oscillospiraceae bacterium]